MESRFRNTILRATSAALLASTLAACGGNKETTPTPAPIFMPQYELTPSPALLTYINSLPRNYGSATWSGEWKFGPSIKGAALVRPYFEGEQIKHIIETILIPTLDGEGNPLSIEQQQVVAKKESYGHLCSYNYIDQNIFPLLSDETVQSVGSELDLLADGLAVFTLTREEQDLLGTDYLNPKYNYKPDGTPFFRDPLDPTTSMITDIIEWDCESPVTPAMIAAVHVMSEGQKIINSGGIETIGPILIESYFQQ